MIYVRIVINIIVPLESVNTICQAAKLSYRNTNYCPDMTIIFKSLDIKKVKKWWKYRLASFIVLVFVFTNFYNIIYLK